MALQNLNKAIELKANYGFAYWQRVETYNGMKKYDLAINDLKEIEKFTPNDIKVMNHIGIFYGKLQRFDLAFQYYQKCLLLEKKPFILLNMTENSICQGNFPAAERTANEASGLAKDIRDRIFAKYLLVTTLILSKKEYILELKEMIEIFKANPDFSVGAWFFEEVLTCLPKFSVEEESKALIQKIILMLKKEIRPEEIGI